MYYSFDSAYTLEILKKLLYTPSPVGYYVRMKPVIEELAASLGCTVTYDNRSTAYITLDGVDNSKTVLVGAHMDTNGLVVRRIDADGKIRMRTVGGINYYNVDGCTVTVLTRDGRSYTGLLTCQSHSTHVFDDARTLPRDDYHMMVILDEKVSSRAEVEALGIRHGDYIAVDPQYEVTEKGFVKARFLDDKAACACAFTMLKYIVETGAKPRYRTMLAFPFKEEIGLGGSYVPPEVSEYLAIDIGLIGPDLDGNEFSVSICAKDAKGPYDYELTNELIALAEKTGTPYALDIFNHYSTDGNAAQHGGCNVRSAAMGMAVYCSHGRERTHIEGLDATTQLMIAYVLGV